MLFDPEMFGQAMGEAIRKAVAPLHAEIDVLKRQLSALGGLRAGIDGQDGKDGKDGSDGKSFTIEDAETLLDTKMARWELDFERRAHAALEKAIDRMPAPKDGKDGVDGKNGINGIGFDDMDVSYDGERTITLKFQRGDAIKDYSFSLPVQIDRGVFKAASQYQSGDGVTWAGSYWIAQKDAPTGKPGEPGSEGWRLAVKKGRDGKDGRNGIDKTSPVKLEPKE